MNRRGFLHTLGVAALALATRKIPKALRASSATHTTTVKPSLPRILTIQTVLHKDSWVRPYIGVTHHNHYLGELAGRRDEAFIGATDTELPWRPMLFPMREPTEQEYEKWRAHLEGVVDKILPWAEEVNAANHV